MRSLQYGRHMHCTSQKEMRSLQKTHTLYVTERDEKSIDINQNKKYIYLPSISCVAWKQIFETY